ncbi:MAG: hypothetical protein Q8P54_00060 [bacterium]|nr:hypothetical protein [bacterium]
MSQDLLIIVLSISTMILLILAIIATILFIMVIKRIKYVSEKAQEGTDAVVEMVGNVRDSIVNPSIIAGIVKAFRHRSKDK